VKQVGDLAEEEGKVSRDCQVAEAAEQDQLQTAYHLQSHLQAASEKCVED